MAARKNPNTQAVDRVLDEYRAIKKRGKRVRKPLFPDTGGENPLAKLYRDNRINPDLFRTQS